MGNNRAGKTMKMMGRILRVAGFLKLLFNRFVEDQGMANAASLTYTTLLSLVPLMTVSLAVFAAFPISGKVADEIQSFVFDNFVPASGEVLQAHLRDFSKKASELSGTGFAFLVVVALMMMGNIDRAFNTIWRVRRKRSPINLFMVYWSILTLAPLLIGVSVAVTSYLVSVPLFTDVATLGGNVNLLGMAPMLASSVAFSLLYLIVPNRRVTVVHAVAGGVLAAILFEVAKRGFAFYVTTFPTYEAIYGALAVIPIFLVWIYLCWIITLLGAEFTYCLSLAGKEHGALSVRAENYLLQSCRLLQLLWQGQQQGEARSMRQLSRRFPGLSEEAVEGLLLKLQAVHFVLATEDGRWMLARDLSEVTLYDLYRATPFILPETSSLAGSESALESELAGILDPINLDLEQGLSMPLEQVFSNRKSD
jgi:membrane protein